MTTFLESYSLCRSFVKKNDSKKKRALRVKSALTIHGIQYILVFQEKVINSQDIII